MNQIIYGDDLTNNEHPFTKGMKELVKNLNAVDDIANKKQTSNVVTVVQSISQLKQEWWQMQKDTIFRGVFNLLSTSHNYSYAKLYLTFCYFFGIIK